MERQMNYQTLDALECSTNFEEKKTEKCSNNYEQKYFLPSFFSIQKRSNLHERCGGYSHLTICRPPPYEKESMIRFFQDTFQMILGETKLLRIFFQICQNFFCHKTFFSIFFSINFRRFQDEFFFLMQEHFSKYFFAGIFFSRVGSIAPSPGYAPEPRMQLD